MGQQHHHLGGRTSPNPRQLQSASRVQGHLWVRKVASPLRHGHAPVLVNPAGAAASQAVMHKGDLGGATKIDLPQFLPLHDPLFRQVSESPELLTRGEMSEIAGASGTSPFEALNRGVGITARRHPSFGENGKLIQPRHRPTIS